MNAVLCALVVCATALCSSVFGEEVALEPKGVYATIDTKSSARAIAALTTGTDEEKSRAIKEIESHSDTYCPAVFFSLAKAFFDIGRTDDSLFWLYAGRIRTRYDIRRCTDETVEGGYEELNASVPDLLKLLQFENSDATKKIVKKALTWDETTPYHYDPRWIALHGMGAIMSAMDSKKRGGASLTIPEKEWKGLAEKNRKEYWDTFQKDFESITPEQYTQIRARIKELKQNTAATKAK
jgi:hypothetical protein